MAIKKFDKADLNKDGKVTMQEQILAAIGTVLGAAYSVWLCNRVLFGPLQTEVLSGYSDLVRREAAVFAPLIFMTLWMGIYPEVFLQPIHLSILYLCA